MSDPATPLGPPLVTGKPIDALQRRLFLPIDIASLVVFRVVFGAIMVWEVCRYFHHDWILGYYIRPRVFFTYYGFSWVRPWPGDGMYTHFAVLGILAFFIAIGFFYRLSALLFFLGFTYVFLLDQSNYLNHFYFVSLMSFLMILVPAHRAASVDAWLRPRIRSNQAAAWHLWILRAQLAVIYIGAGVAKLNADYFCGEPMRMWLFNRTEMDVLGLSIGQYFDNEWAVWFFSAGGLLFDLFIVPALLWRRTRIFGLAAMTFFHLMNSLLFNIGIFPWISLGATWCLFLPPDWPRRVLSWKQQPFDSAECVGPKMRPTQEVLITWFLGLYMAIQVLVPLRHWLYPSSVHWTEEGHRFSWHMKLRDKEAEGEFLVVDSQDRSTKRIDPADYPLITRRQRTKMLKTPDMILQFAHHLAKRFRKETGRDAAVYARIHVSLNGRRPQMLIDPTVDLARTPRNLWHAKWILPLTTPLEDRAVPGHDEDETE